MMTIKHMTTIKRMTTACLALALAAAASGQQKVELDVTRVALFSSGVGYFECDAQVDGTAVAELRFRTGQINDIIKSLIVQDFGGGSIGIVRYASKDPIEKTLKSFGVDLTGKPTMAELLDQLRGEPIEIVGSRTAKGIIIGVEKQRVIVGDKTVDIDMLNLLTDAGIQQLRLNELQGVKLTNEKINDELRKALATLAAGHDADKKTVELRFDGKGRRQVRAAYLLETPIWKTSYRLVLSDYEKPFLQGWATVENATEEDWNNVRLSLVSGRPISFRMDLYTPLYVPRPLEELELYASLRPPEFEGGFADKKAFAEKARRPARGDLAAAVERDDLARWERLAKADAPSAGFGRMAGVALKDAGVKSLAAAQDAGELFEYAIKTPVSIPRQHSAMLPIVNQAIDGEKVSIFNPATHAKYPLNGLEFKNTSGLNLMQGPVTVFDGNMYAGDAKLPNLQPGEKRLLAYALDLSVEVMTKRRSHPDQIVSLRIAKGTLWHKRKYIDDRTYVVKNKDDKPRTVLIEQAYTHDWKLIEPAEPYERTSSILRFKAAVPAHETVEQSVRLERLYDQSVTLTSLNLNQIRIYLRARVISAAVKSALQRVVELRTELDRTIRRRELSEKVHAEATAEQNRIRSNLGVLRRSGDVYARQITKFEELETEIGRLRTEIAELRASEEQQRGEFEKYLLSLNVE